MEVWELILIGAALAMDAVAVSMTNGMSEPRMKGWKMLAVAATYAFFQFAMPVVGYYGGYAFSALVERIAPWLSCALLVLIGGKMFADGVSEAVAKKRGAVRAHAQKTLGAGKLLAQAFATSVDALAVGVTLFAEETAEGLPAHAVLCALAIGAITFFLSLPAVALGKRAGNAYAEKAEIAGGVVLVVLGIKILLEALL